MKCRTKSNPYLEMFQRQYDALRANPDYGRVANAIDDLVRHDDAELAGIFSEELGNTWTLWGDKLAGRAASLSAVVLKWDGDGEFPNVPMLVFADGYDSHAITSLSEEPGASGLLESPGDPIFAKASFGDRVFEESGGFDIDIVTGSLFDIAVDENVRDLPVYDATKNLFLIKTLDLALRAVDLTMCGEPFRSLPLGIPFAFFAIPGQGHQPILLRELLSL